MVEIVAEPRREAADCCEQAPGVAEVEVFGERLHVSLPTPSPRRAAEAEAEALAARLREAGDRGAFRPADDAVARRRLHRPHPRARCRPSLRGDP